MGRCLAQMRRWAFQCAGCAGSYAFFLTHFTLLAQWKNGTMAPPIVTNNRLLHPKGKHIHFIQIISNYFHKPLNELGPLLLQGLVNSDFCQLLPPSFFLISAQQAQGHVETWSLEKGVSLKDSCRLTEPRKRKKEEWGVREPPPPKKNKQTNKQTANLYLT